MKDNTLEGKTIIYARGSATAGSVTFYTVTAGKTLYIVQAGLEYEATSGARACILGVGGTVNRLLMMRSKYTSTYYTQDSGQMTVAYPHPIPIAAETILQVNSAHANLGAQAWIVGWEE